MTWPPARRRRAWRADAPRGGGTMTKHTSGNLSPVLQTNETERPMMKSGDGAWLMIAGALVLFMTPGLALFYGGMDRTRNVLNMLMMNFWCLLIVPVLWVVIGYSLA